MKHPLLSKPNAILALLLAAWWLLNLVQGAFTELADDEAYYCLYNLGSGYYLTIGTRVTVSDVPHKLNLNYSNKKFVIREGTSKYIGINYNKIPITVNGTKAAGFELALQDVLHILQNIFA